MSSRSRLSPGPRTLPAPWERLESRLLLSGEIRGVQFADLDADGHRDPNEPGMSGWTIYLDLNRNARPDADEPTTLTASDGAYAFANIAPGFYAVGSVNQPYWRQTAPQKGPSTTFRASASLDPGLPAAIDRASDLSHYSRSELESVREWVVGLPKNRSPRRLATALGARSAMPSPFLPRAYVIRFDGGKGKGLAARAALERGNFDFFYPLVEPPITSRFVPNDPRFPQQWHLRNTGQTQGTANEDGNFTSAWDLTRGAGALVGVVDDGLEYFHRDLFQNVFINQAEIPASVRPNLIDLDSDGLISFFDLNHPGNQGAGKIIDVDQNLRIDGKDVLAPLSTGGWSDDLDGPADLNDLVDDLLGWDFNGSDADAQPYPFDDHGTPVAGVVAARGDNNLGVSGAAPSASLVPIRLTSEPASDAVQASALAYLRDLIGVYNNSWGPDDTGDFLASPGPLLRAAIAEGATLGRDGKGNVFVWAGGNGRSANDNVNYDGFASNRYVIAVGAVDHKGKQTSYSEPGASLLVVAHSDSKPTGPGITTTAREDAYTSSFGGTSSATATVSGVVALMRSANPNLTARDVKQILIDTARKNDASDPGWTQNGAGRWINHKYGFGVIDAAAAVNRALGWTSLGPEGSATSGPITVNQPVPDNNTTGVTSSVTIRDALRVESVEVVFDASHARRGDLEVILVGPDGTESVLAEKHNDLHANYSSWTFTSARHHGELSRGTWTLKVRDRATGAAGTLNHWQLNLYGEALDGAMQYANVRAGQITTGLDFGSAVTDLDGTAGDDAFYVALSDNGSQLEIRAGASPTSPLLRSYPASAVGELVFNTSSGDDQLFIQTSATPLYGVRWQTTTDSTTGDVLHVLGSPAHRGTFQQTNTNITFTIDDDRPIRAANVESVAARNLAELRAVTPRGRDDVRIEKVADDLALTGTSDDTPILPVTFSQVPIFTLDTAAMESSGLAANDEIDIDVDLVAMGVAEFRILTGEGANELDIDEGTTHLAILDPDGALSLRIDNDGTVVNLVAAGVEYLRSLELDDASQLRLAPGGARTLVLQSLVMGPAALLDLADNDLIVKANPSTRDDLFGLLRARIASARNTGSSGPWGGRGITSSAARTDAARLTGLALIRNTDDGTSPVFHYFNDEYVNASALLVKYTWNGDSDAGGSVTADDFARIDRGFVLRSVTYRWGDVDYDNVVDLDDYALLDEAFLAQSIVL